MSLFLTRLFLKNYFCAQKLCYWNNFKPDSTSRLPHIWSYKLFNIEIGSLSLKDLVTLLLNIIWAWKKNHYFKTLSASLIKHQNTTNNNKNYLTGVAESPVNEAVLSFGPFVHGRPKTAAHDIEHWRFHVAQPAFHCPSNFHLALNIINSDSIFADYWKQ